jgi:hypothetical protein
MASLYVWMNGVSDLVAVTDGGRSDLYQISRLVELISVVKSGGGRTCTIYVDL